MSTELIGYVKAELAAGTSPDLIRAKLAAQGWDDGTISASLSEARESPPGVAEQNGFTSPEQGHSPLSSPGPAGQLPPAFEREQQQQPSSSANFLPGRRRIGLWLVSAAVIILLSGGSAWGYYVYFPPPERVLGNMFAHLADLKSFRYSISAQSETQNPLFAGDVGVRVEGISDVTDPALPKSQFIISLEHDSFGFRLEIVTVGKTFYFRLEKAPAMLAYLGGKWVKADAGVLAQQFGTEVEIGEGSEIERETTEKVRDLIGRSRFVKVTENKGIEVLNGAKVYHYAFELDRDGIERFLVELAETVSEKELSEEESGRLLAALSHLPTGELWIGRWDHLLRRAKIDWTDGKESAALTLDLSDFNKTLDWQEPQTAITVEEAMALMFGISAQPPGFGE